MAAVLAVAVTAVMAVLAGTADTAYVPLNSLTITSLYTNRTESEADDGGGPSPRVDREDHHRLGGYHDQKNTLHKGLHDRKWRETKQQLI